ncbi:MAG: hypothetical protein R2787_02845 [Saprospiraceae bacterium]
MRIVVCTLIVSLWILAISYGQETELSWQPFPYFKVDRVLAQEDGYVQALSSEYNSGPILQKRNWQGELLWEAGPYWNSSSAVTSLAKLNGKRTIFFWSGLLGCDLLSPQQTILLDSLGQEVDFGFLQPEIRRVLKVINLPGQSDSLLLAWWNYNAWQIQGNIPLPCTLIQLDLTSANIAKTEFPLTGTGIGDAPALVIDPNDQIWIGLPNGGIGQFHPATQEITDTQATGLGLIQDILFPPSTSRILLGDEVIARVDDQGKVLVQTEIPGFVALHGEVIGDKIMIRAGKKETEPGASTFFILDSLLNVEQTLDTLPNGSVIEYMLAHQDKALVFGNDHLNTFVKTWDPVTGFEPLRQDAHLVEVYVGNIALKSGDTGEWFPTCTIRLSDFYLHIQNDGQDTLERVLVNWNQFLPQESFVTFDCKTGLRQLLFDDLHLAPGASDWYAFPEIDLWVIKNCHLPYQLNETFCMELSCPNNRIDADHSNDAQCIPIDVLLSSIEDLDQATQIKISPNPFRDQFTLKDIPLAAQSLIIIDQMGQTFFQAEVNSSTLQMSLPPGPSGLYHLVLLDQQNLIFATHRLLRIPE